MARVTVEDCLKNVKNRFELVIIAAKRARQLMRGKDAKVEWDNDKSTVVALREIAAGFTDFSNPDHRHEDEDEAVKVHVIKTETPSSETPASETKATETKSTDTQSTDSKSTDATDSTSNEQFNAADQ